MSGLDYDDWTIPFKDSSHKDEPLIEENGISQTDHIEAKEEVNAEETADAKEEASVDEEKEVDAATPPFAPLIQRPVPLPRKHHSPRLTDGNSQIFRWYVFGPSGLKDYGSATLRCKI